MPANWRTPKVGYLVAIVSMAIVVLLRFALVDWVHDRIPVLLPMVVVVFLASWCGGLKPGVLATALGMVVGWLAIRELAQRSSPMTDRIRMIMFVAEGLAISASFEAMHKARRRLESKQHQLEDEVRERKRIEQELIEADRHKNEFLATLAHELRNPLAPIRNCLTIVHQNPNDPSIRANAHRILERQVQHLVRLVDDLLDVSRISRNKLELHKENLTLAKVIQAAVETSVPLIDAAGHQLAISLPEKPILLEADPIRLAQLFANLLNNAAKYMDEKGRIWITAETTDQDVIVKIRDTGIGIPANMLPRIFDIFTQVGGQERSLGGLGIGLSLVKRLAELHGGRVDVHSAGLGQGSEFIVSLPRLVDPNSLTTPKPIERADPIASAGYRVLVVDDNEDVVSSMQSLLTSLGNEVQTAFDGVAALEAAETFQPDVVVLDLRMPRLNGYDAARQIRQQPWGKQMVLIAHTGWGQEDDRRHSQEAGFDFHLVKPVAPEALVELLAGLPNSRI